MTEFLNLLPPIAMCLIVCFAKILEISIQSLKTVLMVKGQRILASVLGFIEVMIWGLVISAVITTLGDDIWLLLFYCIGYASGLYLGSLLEERLALGTVNIQLIANNKSTEALTTYLYQQQYGYTVLRGHGAKDESNMIIIVVQRKQSRKLLKMLHALEDVQFFEVTSDVSKFTGGYGVRK